MNGYNMMEEINNSVDLRGGLQEDNETRGGVQSIDGDISLKHHNLKEISEPKDDNDAIPKVSINKIIEKLNHSAAWLIKRKKSGAAESTEYRNPGDYNSRYIYEDKSVNTSSTTQVNFNETSNIYEGKISDFDTFSVSAREDYLLWGDAYSKGTASRKIYFTGKAQVELKINGNSVYTASADYNNVYLNNLSDEDYYTFTSTGSKSGILKDYSNSYDNVLIQQQITVTGYISAEEYSYIDLTIPNAYNMNIEIFEMHQLPLL